MGDDYDKSDPFGATAHNKFNPDHSGKYGHFCVEWDGLYICQDCSEFKCCTCLNKE